MILNQNICHEKDFWHDIYFSHQTAAFILIISSACSFILCALALKASTASSSLYSSNYSLFAHNGWIFSTTIKCFQKISDGVKALSSVHFFPFSSTYFKSSVNCLINSTMNLRVSFKSSSNFLVLLTLCFNLYLLPPSYLKIASFS